MSEEQEDELKPVNFKRTTSRRAHKNKFQQNMLLKGLTETLDLDELQKIAHFKSKAEVLETMDKIKMRKEFHRALAKHGVDMDSIAGRLSDLIDSDDEKTALKALKTVMKSIGIDKYDDVEDKDKNWEEVVVQIEKEKRKQGVSDDELPGDAPSDKEDMVYEVDEPDKPDFVEEKEEKDQALGESLYE